MNKKVVFDYLNKTYMDNYYGTLLSCFFIKIIGKILRNYVLEDTYPYWSGHIDQIKDKWYIFYTSDLLVEFKDEDIYELLDKKLYKSKLKNYFGKIIINRYDNFVNDEIQIELKNINTEEDIKFLDTIKKLLANEDN